MCFDLFNLLTLFSGTGSPFWASSPSASDENRRLRMLWNNRNMGGLGKDELANPVGDVVPNVGSPLQAGGFLLPRRDTDMLIKVLTLFLFPFRSYCILINFFSFSHIFLYCS